MSIIFQDGFGKYGPNGSSFSSVQSVFDTGYVLSGGGSINFVSGFSAGTSAVQMSRSTSAAPRLSRQITTTEDVVIIGFELSATARFDGFFTIEGVTKIDWPAAMAIEGNSGSAIPILNTGYYVELKITKSTKAYVMKLNGYPYIDGTLATSSAIPNTLNLQWGFPSTGSGAAFKVSNIVIVDSSVGKYTDFIGPQTIKDDRPTASVTPIEWDPIPSNKTNVQIMQNNPPLPSEYTKSDVVGESDYYTSSAAVSGNVTAVAVTAIIGKTDIDSQKVKVGIGSSGSRKESEEIEVEVQPKYISHVFETDEADADWNAGSATSVAFGVTIQPRP